ncbi:hypothetical protein MBLNU459_g0289t1 [Dothideomycetes sp. NU459]
MAVPGSRRFNVNSVAIIGAGPSGIAAAKYLSAEGAFQKIDVFEQRSRVGGVWDYASETKSAPEDLSIPQLSPNFGLGTPIWNQSTTKEVSNNGVVKEPQFLSPLYDRLETNIPRTLMGFSDFDWPQDAQLFPKHETVTQYIEDYSKDVKHLITFQTQVLDVSIAPTEGGGHPKWIVKTSEVEVQGSGRTEQRIYDAVIIASGHFAVPYIPDIKGIKAWSGKYPNAISHSMYYQKPEQYNAKKVVVVGNSASGMDIAMQIVTVCKWPLLHSSRSESFLISDPSPKKQDCPEIVEFILEDRAVRFADGTVEKDVDNVLFCTGYFYSFPFLDSVDPPLIGDGTHVTNLYQHMFYRPQPTLAFPVLQQRVIPFPMAEVQSSVIARVWSGRLPLPSDAEMKAWEEKTAVETGGGRNFHLLKFPKDADYINAMHEWAMSAKAGKSKGKEPPFWGEKQYWLREQFPAIKKAFQDRGEDRHSVRSIEELGFDFDRYKKEKQVEQKSLL